ncbi:helix-turn-helix domain-containing protein [Bradyrhizobium septentrionale]|uniref:helix-turn-helix domain-containing protein n=1 Tax=Bradyrhizobium septentrionale TaxID=1404411 RepID=UPI00159676CC|nr:helix-turn-helix domain-containing protein [Bradyrhizobium septentrionale]UGY21837.1 helix-turn-helix domain-containing protein [Bradyrhizobium septentrionale]
MSSVQPISGHKGRDRWMCALAAASDLSTIAIRLALRLCVSFNCKTGQCDPGYPKLAEDMAVSKRTVSRAIDELETAGWISVDRTGGDNTRNAQINLLIPGARETRSGDNMLSPENPSLQVTENAPSGDRNGGVQVTDRVAAQITCEPVNLNSPAVPAAGRTSRGVRESTHETPMQRAEALHETVTEQDQQPPRNNPIGTATTGANGSDPGTEALRRVQFLNVKVVYPPDRIGDEEVAFRTFCATKGERPLMEIVEDVKSVVRDDNGNVPLLSDTLLTLARGQARRTGTQ